jgi:hypothetical protein
MTKRQALEECKKMWEWLAHFPEQGKQHYTKAANLINHCPCCHYVGKGKHYPTCSKGIAVTPKEAGCPLATLWPNGCVAEDSPYKQWYVDDSHNPKCARQIVAACDVALAALPKRKAAKTAKT